MTIPLTELQRVAAELNRASDELNEAIRDFEDRLHTANFRSERSVKFSHPSYAHPSAVIISHLAFDGDKLIVWNDQHGPQPLLTTSRETRIAAPAAFADLVATLTEEARERLAEVTQAIDRTRIAGP